MDEDFRALERATLATPGDARAWLRLAVGLERLRRPHACLAAARRALAVDGRLDAATTLARRIFPEVAKLAAGDELRVAIGRALGLAGSFENAPSWDLFELLAGGLDTATGAVAWVEDRTRPRRVDPSPVHVECHTELRIAKGGREVRAWPLEHYNPFFETTVYHLHLEGERAAVVYHEKHGIVAAVVPFVGAVNFVRLRAYTPVLVTADRIIYATWDEDGKGCWIGGHTMPGLASCRRIRLWGEFATDEVFLDEILAGIAPSPPSTRRLRIDDDTLLVPLKGGREQRIRMSDLVPE